MSAVVLTPRGVLTHIPQGLPVPPLEAEGVRPDAFASLSESEIAGLPVRWGKEKLRLGDFFEVRGGRSAELRIAGDAARVHRLGAGMQGGTLLVEGDVGAHVGAGMTGGELRVEGSAGDFAGAELRGGLLEVRGRAGDFAGGAYAGSARGMTGGIVVVRGGAGAFAGERMRRGFMVVGGDAGDHAGLGMIAGTLLVLGSAGRRPGAGLKRGSIVLHGPTRLLQTYRYACTCTPSFLALYEAALRRHWADGFGRFTGARYRRYTGDYAELGKGEILVWAETPA